MSQVTASAGPVAAPKEEQEKEEKPKKAAAAKSEKPPKAKAEPAKAAAKEPKKEATAELPKELQCSHPLQCGWTLWYLKALPDRSWDQCLKKVCFSSFQRALTTPMVLKVWTFHTVEEFFALYHNMRGVGALTPTSDLSVFKEGIRPTWEDKANADGGKWQVCLVRSLISSLFHLLPSAGR